MAVTLPCLSRAARVDQLLTASPKVLGRAVSFKFGSTPTSKGAHFSPFCGQRVGFNNLDTATPRAFGINNLETATPRAFGFKTLETPTPRAFGFNNLETTTPQARQNLGVAQRFLPNCSSGTSSSAFFAPFSSCALRSLPAVTPKSLMEMVAADQADSFCLREESCPSVASADDGSADMACTDMQESHDGFLASINPTMQSAFFVPFQAEEVADDEDMATPIALADMVAAPSTEAFLSSLHRSEGAAFFAPFTAELVAEDQDVATPRCLTDMSAPSTEAFLSSINRSGSSVFFAPFTAEAVEESQDPATPRALADMVAPDSFLSSINRSASSAFFAPFNAEMVVGEEQETATPRALADWSDATERFCFETVMPQAPTTTHFLPLWYQSRSDSPDSATPKALADMVSFDAKQNSSLQSVEDSGTRFCDELQPRASSTSAHFSPFHLGAGFSDAESATPRSMAQW